jgi:hypothetical protein
MSFALPATMEGGKMSVVRGRLERMDGAGWLWQKHFAGRKQKMATLY